MPDIFTKQKRSDVMSRIRSAGNEGTELRLIRIFRTNGITGWRRGCIIRGPAYAPVGLRRGKQTTEDRRQKNRFSVRPDFVFPKHKAAVFVDGCFWHGCPKHATQPRTNAKFWREKIAGNRTLRAVGWTVVRVWEHELLHRDEAKLVRRLLQSLPRVRQSSLSKTAAT